MTGQRFSSNHRYTVSMVYISLFLRILPGYFFKFGTMQYFHQHYILCEYKTLPSFWVNILNNCNSQCRRSFIYRRFLWMFFCIKITYKYLLDPSKIKPDQQKEDVWMVLYIWQFRENTFGVSRTLKYLYFPTICRWSFLNRRRPRNGSLFTEHFQDIYRVR